MQAQCQDQALPTLASSSAEAEQLQMGHFAYQGATVLAILLFLISFWSC